MKERVQLGKCGENFAEEVLRIQGYDIAERNYRCKIGEIDLIAEKNDEICFVEVKTRQTDYFGTPAESVSREKQRKIRAAATFYLQGRKITDKFVSFQVIEIYINQIEHAF